MKRPGTTAAKTEFVSFSFDVSVEGKGVVRANDLMVHKTKNTQPTPPDATAPGSRDCR